MCHFLSLSLLLLFSLVACRPALTLQTLRNASYTVLLANGSILSIPLTDGVYRSGQDSSQPDFVAARLGDHLAFGDLNGDGADDAVLTLSLQIGEAGTSTALIPVLNQNGAAQQPFPVPVENVPVIHALSIADGAIFLSATVHGINDPPCCPSRPVTKTYRLLENHLWLTRLTSRASPTAPEHLITIESPDENAEVSRTVLVSGRVTVAPFEGTLLYRIRAVNGNTLEEGPLMVDAAEPGAAGTFTLTFESGALGHPGLILVEFWDLSAADGSPIAMAAILLRAP